MAVAKIKEQITIGNIILRGFVYIPPMAGYTDRVYRQLCREFDSDVLMSTEMLSSKAMMYENQNVHKMDIPEGENLTGIQLFGHEPDVMAKAAEMASVAGASFIDINMGCPVPKITKGKDGAALMKEPDLACQIVKAVINATHLPVTVKTRLGWCYESINAPDLAKRFEDIGVRAMTIHGRTRSQKYEGQARWDLIAKVVEAVKIPIFANGDIRTIEDVSNILRETGAAGVAIARGTMGRPWFSRQVNHFIKTGEHLPDPDIKMRLKLALRHCKLLIEYKGEQTGLRESRKHIINYTSGLQGAAKVRGQLSTANSYHEVEVLMNELGDKCHFINIRQD